MSDVICDVCKHGCEPALEALNHRCGHLVHICAECERAIPRPVIADVGSIPDDVMEAVRTATIARMRGSHVCGDTGGAGTSYHAEDLLDAFAEHLAAPTAALALLHRPPTPTHDELGHPLVYAGGDVAVALTGLSSFAPEVSGVAEQPCGGCGADLSDGNQVCQCETEADGDVTVHPPLRVLRGDGEAPAPAPDPNAELRARSVEFLRDLVKRVEGGEFLCFVGVAWGQEGASVFYSDLPSGAEAVGHLEMARAELVDEFRHR